MLALFDEEPDVVRHSMVKTAPEPLRCRNGHSVSMHQIPTGSNTLVLQGDFPAFERQELFDYWTTATLLTQWWPQEAEVLPGVGGKYCFKWPDMGWTLEGEYKDWEPGEKLAFTWKWNHEPVETEPLLVQLAFSPALAGGTMLTITHGPYDESKAHQENRQGHLEGWIHFCMKLAGLREGLQDTPLMEEEI